MSFNVPINSIAPLPTPTDWVRPGDWITITDVANEVQFLVADTGSKAFAIQTTFIQNSGTNIYIDWGDGVIDTISTVTSTTTEHIYSTGGTPCSRGYNTFKIRIYGDATCVITNAKHIPNFSVTGGSLFYNIGILEAYFGDSTCYDINFLSNYFTSAGASNSVGSFDYLEYVKLPTYVEWNVQMTFMFANCFSLYTVVMPTSASQLLLLSSTFSGCNNLRDINIPSNSTSISTMGSCFSACYNLRTVSLPTNLNNTSTLSSCFQSCYSLKNITIPSINNVTSMSSTFNSCRALQWVKFSSLPTFVALNTPVDLTSAFSGCISLQNVYFPQNCSPNSMYNCSSVFNGCYNLKNITFPTGFDCNTLAFSFASCASITEVVFQSSCPSLTILSSCFNGCYTLSKIILPISVGTSISLSNAFVNCYSLSSVTIPSLWILNNTANAFQNCQSMKTLILPNNAQDSLTTMSGMCSPCVLLEEVIMPTSMNLCSNISSAFSSCINLKSIILPSTLPNVTNVSNAFFSCYKLTNVVFPISMPLANDWSLCFNSCYALESFTFPQTVNTAASFGSTFSNCLSLKSITFPTAQVSSCSSISSIWNKCGSLSIINNLSKIGSLTNTPLLSATVNAQANLLTSLSFTAPLSALALNGISSTNFNKLNSLRLLNTSAGQWTGSSPHINVSYCDLGVAALNQLFTDLTTITSKTINITGCTGAAGCDRSIATAKGWIVVG